MWSVYDNSQTQHSNGLHRILQTINISTMGDSNSEDVVQRVPHRGAEPPTDASNHRRD